MRQLSIIISCILLSLALSFYSFAEDDLPFDSKIGDSFYDTVPDEFSDVITPENEDKLFDISYVIKLIVDEITKTLFSSFSVFGSVVAAVFFASLYHSLSDTLYPSLSGILSMLTKVIFVVLLSSSLEGMISLFSKYITDICAYMSTVSPIMSAVYVMGGRITSAGVSSAGLMLGISLVANLLGSFGVACLRICLAFTVISSVSPKPIEPALSLLKKTLTWGTGLILGLFSLIMGIQTSLAKSADSVSMRTVKFAVGRFVPIVGGALSDALATVSSGLNLIKNTCGTVSIIVLLLMLLPVFTNLAAMRLVLWCGSIFASMFDLSEEKGMLDSLGSIVSNIIALSAMVGVMFIYVMTLFVSVGVSIGGG